ncbi:MAG: carbohydrate-binding family 9-like protein [Gemmatimonadota bacterium]|nr:carbohydrate-binding family 9-like protein [Gemmatimonadota bacterium]
MSTRRLSRPQCYLDLRAGGWYLDASALETYMPLAAKGDKKMTGLPEIPVYQVNRAGSPVTIDGRLDDPAWRNAPAVELVDCVTGNKPRYPTTARMLYDSEWLYVGFHCRDPDIWGTMTGHDEPIYNEEVVEIFIDPAGSLCAYYELEVSPLNTSFDALILNNAVTCGSEGRGDKFQGFTAWDPAGFKHAVHLEGELNAHDGMARYWECEMALRFDELFLGGNIPPRPGDQWRVNLYRIDIQGDRVEESAFSPTGLADFHVPARFGKIVFR